MPFCSANTKACGILSLCKKKKKKKKMFCYIEYSFCYQHARAFINFKKKAQKGSKIKKKKFSYSTI